MKTMTNDHDHDHAEDYKTTMITTTKTTTTIPALFSTAVDFQHHSG